MSSQWPGGILSKTAPTITAPTAGEGGSASGMWTIDEVLVHEKAGNWPKRPLLKELYAWGDNSPKGQLGLGDITDRSTPVQVGALTWTKVAVGQIHTLSIKTDGTLWAWGDNSSAQLGIGAISSPYSMSSPVQVGALTTWLSVSGGYRNSQGITTGNALYACGNCAEGGNGLGNTFIISSPVQVGSLTTWAQVSSGFKACLAIKTDGTLWSWGYNAQGQLGHGNTTSISSPVQVGSLTTWLKLAGGQYHAMLIKNDGTFWACGRNVEGQLGDNSTTNRSSLVQVGSLTSWNDIAQSGMTHSSLAITGT